MALRPATKDELAEFQAQQAAPAAGKRRAATPEEIAEYEASQRPRTRSQQMAQQQIEEGDGPVTIRAPQSTNDMVSEAESADAPEIERLGRDQLKTAYSSGSNMVTGGLANRIRDRPGSDSSFTAAEREAMAKRNPGADVLGTGIGVVLGGARGAGKIIDTGARGLVGAVAPSLARSAGGRIAGATAAAGLSGGVQDRLLGGSGKAGAALGAGFGAAGATVAEAAPAIVSMLKGGKGWVGKYAKAKDSGLLAQAEAEGKAGTLEKGPVGQFKAGGQARDRILTRDEQLAALEDAEQKAAREPHMQSPADQGAIETKLGELGERNKLSTVQELPPGEAGPAARNVRDEGLEAELATLRRKLGPNPSNEDVLKLRSDYQEAAGFGAPDPTAEQRKARKVYMALREGLQDSPIGAADRKYEQAQLARERRNDLMIGSEAGPREVKVPDRAPGAPAPGRQSYRVGDEERMAERLGRLGDGSVPGAKTDPRLAELRAQGDPEINAALDELEGRKSWMATRFGAPEMPTNFSKAVAWPLRFLTQNATAATARGALPALPAAGRAAANMTPAAGTAGADTAAFIRYLRGQK